MKMPHRTDALPSTPAEGHAPNTARSEVIHTVDGTSEAFSSRYVSSRSNREHKAGRQGLIAGILLAVAAGVGAAAWWLRKEQRESARMAGPNYWSEEHPDMGPSNNYP